MTLASRFPSRHPSSQRLAWLPGVLLVLFVLAQSLSYGGQGGGWPLQSKPGPDGDPQQDPATFPRSRVPAQAPVKRVMPEGPVLRDAGSGDWVLSGGWRLQSVLRVSGTARELSVPGQDVSAWYRATVPGTVLTTLVNEGVYPEPTYGLNNMVIPESLARQDYWYRNEFIPPASAEGRPVGLLLKGVNYAAEVWFNGQRLGETRGAFMRGQFDLSSRIKHGIPNVLLVRVSPVPHPGIPHEESLAAGAGVPNGGSMCLDGPTFFCTEGWDWIPGIRDRCTGVWQDVVLHVGGPVVLGDPHIKTDLPLPDLTQADVFVSAAVQNRSAQSRTVVVRAEFEGVRVERPITLAAGESSYAKFGSGEFPALHVVKPRLWWPNGYGTPELYHLTLSVLDDKGGLLDQRRQRFGIRHVTYELSAHDTAGTLQRLDFNPSAAWDRLVIDKRHEALRQAGSTWVPTLAVEAASCSAVTLLPAGPTAPFLVLKVNGVPIPCKGGNWGLDEALKRCSREKLEPFFRLQREANFTMIRNWCGQNTEEVFYELADEYGLMVWNDFWLSTQEWNQQPLDLPLFLANAEDVIKRFRNHPSIVLWCGRNEGVPPPALNEGLDELVRRHDGSRYYQPDSRDLNLLESGPWTYGPPVNFFNKYGLGFSTELGLPNVPSVDAIRAMMPEQDRWPLSDTWAYHDWHQAHHGEVPAFMEAMARQLGAGTGLEDFCRKAQLLNYDAHRALFEGMNARLWAPATGRLMWMSHPAWPSTEWQLYSSDTDTNAAYFAVRKACEPLHIQLNLDDHHVVVCNTTLQAHARLRAVAETFGLDGHLLSTQTAILGAAANATTVALQLAPDSPSLPALRLVRLRLLSADDTLLSDNVYWLPRTEGDLRTLVALPLVALEGSAKRVSDSRIQVTLRNPSKTPVLLVRTVVRDARGERVLPAYATDGCFTLLPGDSRSLQVELGAQSLPAGPLTLSGDGWNLAPLSLPVTGP